MRYLGIDYGLKRIGLAISDAGESIVSPLCQLEFNRGGPERIILELERIIRENEVEAIVVGLPLNMDGSEGRQAQLTRSFAAKIMQAVPLPVHFADERLSSTAADEKLAEASLSRRKRKARRDMLAACEILHDFLNK